MAERPITFLCISSAVKGQLVMQELKRLGARVYLLTEERWRDGDWPHDCLSDIYYMPSLANKQHVINAVSYFARSTVIDRILPLDDYEVDTAATLREHLRIPGMGDTTARYFRDKLAMRVKASEAGIAVPAFVGVINYDAIRDFMGRIAPPYLLKPRGEAGAMGIKKIEHPDELWPHLERLGDAQSNYVLEHFVPGDVYHVDALTWEREVQWATASKYGAPPLSVSHGGGVFTSATLDPSGEESRQLLALNKQLLRDLGMVRGPTHAEFIRGRADGKYYFLEIAARVGGANLADMLEQATGINPWREWARIEIANAKGESYTLGERRHDTAGILVCLAKQEHPDLSGFDAPEVVWRMNKPWHAGLIVRSSDAARTHALLDDYKERFAQQFVTRGDVLETGRNV
ncbi:MAG: hypothetical protein K1X39_00075 [Thermoflexales bacterium]|nr:hypothetical protein [Thermoflexales bacterium]